MSEQTKKPRNIKDFKARLGRKGAKPAGGGPPVPAPPGAGGGKPPVAPPPIGKKKKGVAPPPFGAKKKKATSADPFAASSAPVSKEREVRIVVDDSAVDNAEIGRKTRGKNTILISLGCILGLAIGIFCGAVNAERKLFNAAVEDGESIYNTVRESSESVNSAHRLLERAFRAARGAPGRPPTIDAEAIAELRSMDVPLNANAFANKRYQAFRPQTVDSLFTYYNNVRDLWSRIERLTTMVHGEERLAQLSQAAEAANSVTTNQTGCALQMEEQQLTCVLGFIAPNAENPAMQNVRPTLGSRQSQERTVFRGQDDLLTNPSNYVLPVNTRRSVGVLGEQATLFRGFLGQLQETMALSNSTRQVQGRLETSIGQVAALEPMFAF